MSVRRQAWIDQENANLKALIRKHGWSIQYVGGDSCSAPGCDHPEADGPAFGYTIGLFGLGHPELLIFGCPPETTAGILNDLGNRIRKGSDLVPGQIVTFENWPHRVIPEPVPNPGEIAFSAQDYYRCPIDDPVPLLQLSYDDTKGRFPWEDGYATPELQPRPGSFSA